MASPKGKYAEEFEYAIATEADYAGVMDIDRNMYDGIDYLPKKYFEYVNDPYRLCVVVKHHHKIIGFTVKYIVDDGKTVISQAGRVHSDYQSQGISAFIEQFTQKLLRKKYHIERMVWTTTDREASDGLASRHIDVSYIMERPRLSLDFSTQQLGLIMKSEGFAEVFKMSQTYSTRMAPPSGFKGIMTKYPQDVAAMTPEGFWVVDWVPFKTMPSNWDLMTRDANIYVTMAKEGGLLAVSFGACVEVRIGLRYRAEYFVRPEYANDKELLVSHLVEHLIHIHQFYKITDVSFSLSCPQSVAKTSLKVKELVGSMLDLHSFSTTEKPFLVLKWQLSPSKSPSKL